MAKPDKIKIPYEDDDYSRFNCVGTHLGKQFMAFVTGADPINSELGSIGFPDINDPDWQKKKRWYGVIHLFEMDGSHSQTVTFLGGTTAEGKDKACQNAFNELNAVIMSMQNPQFCDIHIKLFEHREEDYLFGLIYEDTGENEYAMLWPNDIMFHPPWDSGDYST